MMSEEMRSQQIEMLIRFFNMQAGASFRVGKQENRDAVSAAIDRADGNIVAIKNFVREWASAHKGEEVSVIDCFDAFKKEELAPAPVVEEVQVQAAAPAPEMSAKTALDFLGAAVVDILAKTKTEEIQKAIMDSCEQKVRDFIKTEYGTIERKVVTVIDGKKIFEGDIVQYQPKYWCEPHWSVVEYCGDKDGIIPLSTLKTTIMMGTDCNLRTRKGYGLKSSAQFTTTPNSWR